jgi:hypothetical protein
VTPETINIDEHSIYVARIDHQNTPMWLCDGHRITSMSFFASKWWDPWKLFDLIEAYKAKFPERATPRIVVRPPRKVIP